MALLTIKTICINILFKKKKHVLTKEIDYYKTGAAGGETLLRGRLARTQYPD
jgi:hypothetical protein